MKNNGPLVSVIITCYNYAETINDAIESVVLQTYPNIEIIVINDGSTDNSDAVIEKLSKKFTFTYINKKNEGVIATRNRGVSAANGEFQMQLDADDKLDHTYVQKCVDTLIKTKADIAYTQYKTFGRISFESKQIDHDLEKLKHDNYIHGASLVRSSRLGKDPYDSYLKDKGNEDWDLFLDLCMSGARAVLVDEPLLLYRKHEDRSSRSDSFEGTINEVLVRHHIWSKQNAKHPDQFWYFSSQIELLLGVIKVYERLDSVDAENTRLKRSVELLTIENSKGVIQKMAEKIYKYIRG